MLVIEENINAINKKVMQAIDARDSDLIARPVQSHASLITPALPVAVDTNQATVTLQTGKKIETEFRGVKTAMRLSSNIFFGLPRRILINREFLLMTAYTGLAAVILNSLNLIITADMLTGHNQFYRAYSHAYNKGILLN